MSGEAGNPDGKDFGADQAALAARIREREIGSDRVWHEARSLALARLLENGPPADMLIDTDDRAVTVIAGEIATQVAWLA